MVRTFNHFELAQPTYAATKSIIGLTLNEAIAKMIGQDHIDERIRAMTEHYKEIYGPVREEPGFQEPLYDGIAEVIAALVLREETVLGAVTGKSRKGLNLIADTHGLQKTFFVSRTADDCPSKPHPAMVLECCRDAGIDPEHTIVIGDSVFDILMAKSAGARAIGVSWGYGEVADLHGSGADAVVHSPSDLLSHI
jgi:phosphoglycolate phosphatase